jgi:hypothetical protein
MIAMPYFLVSAFILGHRIVVRSWGVERCSVGSLLHCSVRGSNWMEDIDWSRARSRSGKGVPWIIQRQSGHVGGIYIIGDVVPQESCFRCEGWTHNSLLELFKLCVKNALDIVDDDFWMCLDQVLLLHWNAVCYPVDDFLERLTSARLSAWPGQPDIVEVVQPSQPFQGTKSGGEGREAEANDSGVGEVRLLSVLHCTMYRIIDDALLEGLVLDVLFGLIIAVGGLLTWSSHGEGTTTRRSWFCTFADVGL